MIEGERFCSVDDVGDRHKLHPLGAGEGSCEGAFRYDVHVSDREHPAAEVSAGVIEDLELLGGEALDSCLVA